MTKRPMFATMFATIMLAASAFAGETITGGIYTFTGSTIVQVSSFAGTAKLNSLSISVPGGACSKVFVGINTNFYVLDANGDGAIRVLFPSACNAPTGPVGQVVDHWTLKDFLYNVDGIDPADYWVLASPGAQLQWQASSVGVAATKILRPQYAGLLFSATPPGIDRLEASVLPGNNYKVLVCDTTGTTVDTACFATLYPMYYVSGVITTPVAQSWVYESHSLNAINTTYELYGVGTNGSGTGLFAYWKYQ